MPSDDLSKWHDVCMHIGVYIIIILLIYFALKLAFHLSTEITASHKQFLFLCYRFVAWIWKKMYPQHLRWLNVVLSELRYCPFWGKNGLIPSIKS